MLSVYDLYDLYAIITNIRARPQYALNSEILMKVIGILKGNRETQEDNQLRNALRAIDLLDRTEFGFVYTDNVYVYYPAFLVKDDKIYTILTICCENLLTAVKEEDFAKVEDLADSLHNLPIYIANNNLTIPKIFWRREVKHIRAKWDKGFLKR